MKLRTRAAAVAAALSLAMTSVNSVFPLQEKVLYASEDGFELVEDGSTGTETGLLPETFEDGSQAAVGNLIDDQEDAEQDADLYDGILFAETGDSEETGGFNGSEGQDDSAGEMKEDGSGDEAVDILRVDASGDEAVDILRVDASEDEVVDELIVDALGDETVEELTEDVWDEEFIEDSTEEADPLASMLPLREVKAYLVLNGYSEDELENLPIRTVLDKLQDKDGNRINIPDGANIVWARFTDESGNAIRDEYHTISDGDVLDLSDSYEKSMGYRMDLIVGSGNQLDAESIRYRVKVYISGNYSESFHFNMYSQATDGSRTQFDGKMEFYKGNSPYTDGDGSYIPLWLYNLRLDREMEVYNPYINMTSELQERPDVSLKIYELDQYLENQSSGYEKYAPVTDLLFEEDMTEPYAGYRLKAQQTRFIVFYYIDGVQRDMIILCYAFSARYSEVKCSLNLTENGKTTDVVKEINTSIDVLAGENIDKYDTELVLHSGYSVSEEYELTLDSIQGSTGENVDGDVVHAVLGQYSTKEEIDAQPDIKDLLFYSGYRGDFSGAGLTFSFYFREGSFTEQSVICQYTYRTVSDEDQFKFFNDTPLVGSVDPVFHLTGLKSGNEMLDTYVIENGKAINMDTYYGYGYQTVLVGKRGANGQLLPLSGEELGHLKPVFELGDDQIERVALENKSGYLTSGVSEVDFSNTSEPVHFIVSATDRDGREYTKNYYVRVISKKTGPSLYVYDGWITMGEDGTYENLREVLLDEYFEEKHDILIANVGDEPLTGLKITLDASNVKLDDYWTVGGQGNDTLAPFTQTSDLSEYGYIDNIAKVRLLPDGDGPVEGYLTISADGQEDVVIHISDSARQPQIVTKTLEDTVKFVPYSFYISTNNMYDWNTQNFTLISGTLPEGMELNRNTGEIYGAPTQTGTFSFEIGVSYGSEQFEPSIRAFTIRVLDNDDETVFRTSSEEYQIVPEEDGLTGYIGERVSDSGYEFELVLDEENPEDEWFISNGAIDDFEKLWLNGVELTRGVDYFTLPGSTMIRIPASIINSKANRNQTNTISAEFRVKTENKGPSTAISRPSADNREIRRTSQNFRVRRTNAPSTGNDQPGSSQTGSNSSGSNSSGGNPSGSNPSGSNPSGQNPSGGNPSEGGTMPTETTIRLNRTSAIVYKGKTLKLTAITNRHVSVRWTTSNKKVATVKNGKVKGKRKGTAVITAITPDGKRASCKVSVQIPIKKITLNKKSLMLKVGKSAKLKASVSPKGASKKGLTWSSSNPKVASVSNGKVKALRKGKTTITVKAPNGKKAKCRVTVYKTIKVKGISISQASATMNQGETLRLTAAVIPANATNQTVTWMSSDPGVVSVADGLLTAISPGMAAIAASTHNGKSAMCVVTVLAPAPAPEAGQDTGGQNLPAEENPGSVTDTIPDPGTGTEPGSGTDPGTDPGSGEDPSDPGGDDPGPASVPAERVVLSLPDDDDHILETGEEVTVTAQVLPADTTDKELTWFSSDESVAAVDGGTVRAVSPGYAFIVASSVNHIRGYVLVIVCSPDTPLIDDPDDPGDPDPQVQPESISLICQDWNTASTLGKGQTNSCLAVLSPSDAVSQITWGSTDESVITVDRYGNVTGVGKGSAYVTAQTENGKSASLRVTVRSPFVEKLDAGAYSVNQGDTLRVNYAIYLDETIRKNNYKYVLYLAYLNSGWQELASFNIDGADFFKERYSGDAHVVSCAVKDNYATVSIDIDTAGIPKISQSLFTVSVFPYDHFATGGSLYDSMTTISVM